MVGIYLSGMAGGPQFAENLQSTKDRLKKNLEEFVRELNNSSDAAKANGTNIPGNLLNEIENLRREINAAEFQISKLQIAEQSLDYMSEKLEQLKNLTADAAKTTEESDQSREQLEHQARKIVDIYNASIESTLFAGHELLNGGDGSVVTIDKIDGINLSSAQAASDSLKRIEQEYEDLSNIRRELEELRTSQLQAEAAALQVTMQNVAAVQSSINDVESIVENSEILTEQLHLQAGAALSAQGNLASSSVLQLIS